MVYQYKIVQVTNDMVTNVSGFMFKTATDAEHAAEALLAFAFPFMDRPAHWRVEVEGISC